MLRAVEVAEQLGQSDEQLRGAALEALLALYVTRCGLDGG